MKNLNVLFFLILIFGCSPSTVEFNVRVEAGSSDRVATPVVVDVPISIDSLKTPVCVIFDEKSYPAQIVSIENGKMQVCWIVSNLAEGQTRNYKIVVGEKCNESGFVWVDDPGKSMDLKFANRPVMKYMYTAFDLADIENTKKPFHQVFSPDGSELITKGVGGKYSHHRGIFYGYQQVMVGDSTYDIWHAVKGEHSVHKKMVNEIAGPVVGGHTVQINWNDRQAKPIIEELRTVRTFSQPEGTLLIEFESSLRTLVGPVSLDGDKQHAGVHFRAAQEVAEHEVTTRFLRPEKWDYLPADKEMDMPEFKNLRWDAMQYNIAENKYSVVYLTDPDNPDNADFSERLYGRFGEFIPYKLQEDKTFTVRYRFWITASHDIFRKEIEMKYDDMVSPPKVILLDN